MRELLSVIVASRYDIPDMELSITGAMKCDIPSHEGNISTISCVLFANGPAPGVASVS